MKLLKRLATKNIVMGIIRNKAFQQLLEQ